MSDLPIAVPLESVRLQKILAEAGLGSRRACEALIAEGRICVNGQVVTQLGTRANPARDKIELDGRPITSSEAKWYVALHKPTGFVSTAHDPQGRPTVLDLVSEVPARLYPVGRLDLDSEGLILLTNDGVLTHALLHPRFHIPKRYHVWVRDRIDLKALERLRSGVPLEDGMTAPAQAMLLEHVPDGSKLEITLFEGRKRQVRRMCEAVGHPVARLVRVSIGPLQLGRLPAGHHRVLTQVEVLELRQAAGVVGPAPE